VIKINNYKWKCYRCNKLIEFNLKNITFIDNLEVLMCKKCVNKYRENTSHNEEANKGGINNENV